ncbi:hypothetical protein G3A39_44650, partial [Paraburkholderia aspalathi]|nr:hypothetical protein [Paraburkholderia aspalathi]
MHANITPTAPISSKQSYGIRYDYPVLTPTAASLALRGETEAFLKAALSFVESHEEGDKP